jgi:hypothetical protein
MLNKIFAAKTPREDTKKRRENSAKLCDPAVKDLLW